MKTEIFIENKRLDLTNDISSLLTFALDDVKDFASRNTTFSKTIVLPGTANNNLLFGNIFDAKISNPYDDSMDNVSTNFNASVSAGCLIFQDHVQVFKGTIRLLEIVINDNVPEYEVAVFGEMAGLIAELGAHLLEELDFSAYDRLLNVTNISTSWINAPGSGVFFPSNIDYGTYSDLKHDWDILGMRPALYVKEYIDKIFEATGYTYQSALFNTERFKRLVVPHNQKILQGLSSNLLGNSVETDDIVLTSAGVSNANLEWENVDTSIFTGSLLNTRFTYTGAPLTMNFSFNITGYRRSLVTNYTLQVYKNGVAIPGTTLVIVTNNGTFSVPFLWAKTFSIAMNTGDYIEFNFIANQSGSDLNYELSVTHAEWNVTSDNPIAVPILHGDVVQMNAGIPKNTRQIDFLSSIVKLFNLYVFEDRDQEKKLFIEPYVDFFDLNVSGVVDWTYKMDRSKSVRLRPMSELNSRYYEFNFKDDSDYYNDFYKKRYNQSYGSRKYDSAFEFASDSAKLDLIFSGTPLVGYLGEDKIYSTMFKWNSGVEDKMDTNIRILQTKNVSGVTSWDILEGTTSLASYTTYGYAGHYDDPDAPANDIQFGVPAELFFILATGAINVTQFNIYWSAYMAEITDKDSKLLIAYFKLTTRDIYELNFSKFIHVDGSIWRLNKITDWNASEPDVCQCELLKVINMIY